MLYKLRSSGNKFDRQEPVEFKDFSSFGNLEKDLEEPIAESILGVLFEDDSLMPMLPERPRQSAANICTLNEKGELVIFELKRGVPGEDAVHQALGYAPKAGRGSFSKINTRNVNAG